MIAQNTYDSVADFIASMNPQRVLEMRASKEMQDRLEILIEKEKVEPLSGEE